NSALEYRLQTRRVQLYGYWTLLSCPSSYCQRSAGTLSRSPYPQAPPPVPDAAEEKDRMRIQILGFHVTRTREVDTRI
ncbi:hypothetical protein JMJ77_0011347, partial [Colletotrichum scovillei]